MAIFSASVAVSGAFGGLVRLLAVSTNSSLIFIDRSLLAFPFCMVRPISLDGRYVQPLLTRKYIDIILRTVAFHSGGQQGQRLFRKAAQLLKLPQSQGIPAVLVGVIIWFYLPDYPETAKFLTEEERAFATKRMGPFAPKGTDKHFDLEDFKKTLKAWQFWTFAAQYFL
jgi:hypothetical protein